MRTIDKLYDALCLQDIPYAIFCLPDNVRYATGFDTPPPILSSNYFAKGLPLSYVFINAMERNSTLIVMDGFLDNAEKTAFISDIRSFGVYNHLTPINVFDEVTACISKVLNENINNKPIIGIERSALPFILVDTIQKLYPQSKLCDCSDLLYRARMVKTEKEIDLIRAAARIGDIAQETLNSISKYVGIDEIDIWSNIMLEVNRAAGESAVVSGELITGPRTSVVNFPGGPRHRMIRSGDCGLMDISIRKDGYWCDCCNVVSFESQNREQLKYFEVAKAAFDAAVSAIKPGITCMEVYSQTEKAYLKRGFTCPHYIGHGIGTGVNDLPRIDKHDQSVLKEGMVFCLEPGCYAGKDGQAGVRVEKMVLVKKDGCEILNKFEWGIE